MGQFLSVDGAAASLISIVREIAGYTDYKCVLPLTCCRFHKAWTSARVPKPAIMALIHVLFDDYAYESQLLLFNLRSREYTEMPKSDFRRGGCACVMADGCYVLGSTRSNAIFDRLLSKSSRCGLARGPRWPRC